VTNYQQQATNAYRERIKQAVWADTEGSWDAAAKVLYEAFYEETADEHWVFETMADANKKPWRKAAFEICNFLAEKLGATALRPAQEETSESVVPNANTRRCIEAYKRRIYGAISGPKEAANYWDKAAAKLRYDYRNASGESTSVGFGAIPEGEKDPWRVAACDFATWIAEQLGETVVDAKPEDFQDDERKLLDIKLGLAPQKQDDNQMDGRLRHKMIAANAFLKALAEVGLIGNLNGTTKVTIVAKAWEDVQIVQEICADERLLAASPKLVDAVITQTEPTVTDFENWASRNPDGLDRLIRQYDRIHGTSGMRRVR